MVTSIALCLVLAQTPAKLKEPGLQIGKQFQSARSIFQSLFGVEPPKKMKVVKFYHDGPGMDPNFAWEFSPLDRAFSATVVKKNGLVKKKAASTTGGYDPHWPQKAVDALPDSWENVDHMGGPLRFWIDPKGNRMFAEFMGT